MGNLNLETLLANPSSVSSQKKCTFCIPNMYFLIFYDVES